MAVDTFVAAYGGVYSDLAHAEANYELVKGLHTQAGLLDAYDAAVIQRRADGKVKIVKQHETPTRVGGVLDAGKAGLAFLLACPWLVGLYLRLRLDETPRFRAIQRVPDVAQRPVSEALRAHPGRMLTGWAGGRCWPRQRSASSGSPCRSTCSSVEAGRSACCSATWPGTAPLVNALLVQRTGNPILPARYTSAVVLAAAIAVPLTGRAPSGRWMPMTDGAAPRRRPGQDWRPPGAGTS